MAWGYFFLPFVQILAYFLSNVNPEFNTKKFNIMQGRIAKIIRFTGRRVDVGVDLYNLFNSNVTTSYQQTYEYATNGASWLNPTAIAAPRLARFNVTVNF